MAPLSCAAPSAPVLWMLQASDLLQCISIAAVQPAVHMSAGEVCSLSVSEH